MTLNEFKAWLEGYSASFKDGTPNADQWVEVQRRLYNVDALFSTGLPSPRFISTPQTIDLPASPLQYTTCNRMDTEFAS